MANKHQHDFLPRFRHAGSNKSICLLATTSQSPTTNFPVCHLCSSCASTKQLIAFVTALHTPTPYTLHPIKTSYNVLHKSQITYPITQKGGIQHTHSQLERFSFDTQQTFSAQLNLVVPDHHLSDKDTILTAQCCTTVHSFGLIPSTSAVTSAHKQVEHNPSFQYFEHETLSDHQLGRSYPFNTSHT